MRMNCNKSFSSPKATVLCGSERHRDTMSRYNMGSQDGIMQKYRHPAADAILDERICRYIG